MFLRRYFRFGTVRVTGAILLLALTPVGMCQTPPGQVAEPASSDTLEEIIVYGSKSLNQLRLERYRAEEKVFVLFNSLNSDDEYDIHCYKEAPIGSRIKRRVCKPNYVKELTAKATAGMLGGLPHDNPAARIRRKDKLLLEEMEALVVERPELLKALSEFTIAKQMLESEHQRRCEGRIIICRR